MFPGYWNPYDKRFYSISERAHCWLSASANVEVDKVHMTPYNYNPRFGFCVRLLKD